MDSDLEATIGGRGSPIQHAKLIYCTPICFLPEHPLYVQAFITAQVLNTKLAIGVRHTWCR